MIHWRSGTLSLAVLLAACAQVREPEGGPKDETPPQLLSAEPANGSVHFEGPRIILHFDERIRTQRVSDNLIISPPLAHPPKVSVAGGKDVVIELAEPLEPNTTYTFNIGDVVLNLSEGLASVGLSYVVSTGDHLDSAQVRGQVVEAFTGKPSDGMIVMLMPWNDSTAQRIGPPVYFTRSNKDGAFLLDHLRTGEYRLCALRDKNANYRYDLPNEEVAFQDGPITAGDSTRSLLRTFIEMPDSQRVLGSRVTRDRAWQLVLAKPFDRGELREVDREGAALTWSNELSLNGDTVLFWPSDTAVLDGLHWAYAENGHAIDTLTYRVSTRMPYNVDLQATVWGDSAVRIRTTRPIKRIREDRFRSAVDSLPLNLGTIVQDSADKRLLTVGLQGHMAKGALMLLPGAVEDIYGGPNDTLRVVFGVAGQAQVGDLVVKVSGSGRDQAEGPWILQLLDAKDQVVRNARMATIPGEVKWPGTPAGKYDLKLISDRDGNGKWTTGSLRQTRLPELVLRNREGVQVRADWDVELIGSWTRNRGLATDGARGASRSVDTSRVPQHQ